MKTSEQEGAEGAASVECWVVGSVDPPLPDDEVFVGIERLRRSTSREATLRLRVLLAEAAQQRLPWHRAYAAAGLALASYV